METNCVFCKIVAGEVPAYKVYEDDLAIAFLDIHPVHPGHTLVVPKAHAANIFEILPTDWAGVAEAVRRVAGAIETGMEADGVNLLMNNREHAGQVVFHAHVHLVPRFKGDGFSPWTHHSHHEADMVDVQKKIAGRIS